MRFIQLAAAFLLFGFGSSALEFNYQKDLEELRRNPPPEIEPLPGGSRFDNTILKSDSDHLGHLLFLQALKFVRADDFDNKDVRQKLWNWYRREVNELSQGLKEEPLQAHFKSWAKRYFDYFVRKDFEKERLQYLEQKRREEERYGVINFHRTGTMDEIEKTIMELREGVSKQYQGSPKLHILLKQNEAERHIHSKVIEALMDKSLDDARNYLSWPRAKESLETTSWHSLMDAISEKANTDIEQRHRTLALQSGGDLALQQLVQDVNDIKNDIEKLRLEIASIRKDVGEDSYKMRYSDYDKSLYAKQARIMKSIEEIIEYLNQVYSSKEYRGVLLPPRITAP